MFEFKIEVKECKDCPHIEWFNWGADCRLNNQHWPWPKKDGTGISKWCPYRTKQIGNNVIKGI